MSWLGRKKIAFVPVHRPNAHPPDDPVPADWPNEIRRRVFYDPDPVSNQDMSLRTYVQKVSSGRADLDGSVMPMLTIDEQNVDFKIVEPLVGAQLRAQGFDAAAIVMLGGPGAGTSEQGGFWARFAMQEEIGTWAMELIHVLGNIFDTRSLPSYIDSRNAEGDISGFDEMGSNLGMHPIAWTKERVAWLDESAIAQHRSGSGNYDLHAIGLPQPAPTGRWSAVRVGSVVPYLMIEARLKVDQFESPRLLSRGLPGQPVNGDRMHPGIASEGVIVYRVQTTDTRGNSQNQLIPVFLLTRIALGVGQSFTSDNGIKVQVRAAIAGGFSITVNDPFHVAVPDVLFELEKAATTAVHKAGLVAQFVHSGTWVGSQSPTGGSVVARGSTVTMSLRPGAPP